MRWLVGNVLLFAGLAVWAAFAHPVVAPAFALLATARGIQLLTELKPTEPHALDLAAASLAVWALGLCYLVALFVGRPTTAAFWLVLGTAGAIMLPAALLFRHQFAKCGGNRSEDGRTP